MTAEKNITIDLETNITKGRYLLFSNEHAYVLIGRNKDHFKHNALLKHFNAQQNSLQPTALTSNIIGAGLYEVQPENKTIEFYGWSLYYSHIPLGPLEELADTIKEKTGFDININHARLPI